MRPTRPSPAGRRSAGSQRPPRRQEKLSATPVLAFVLVVGGALGGLGWLLSREPTAAPGAAKSSGSPDGYVPFSSVPPELPPARAGRRSGLSGPRAPAATALAPSALELEEVWLRSLEHARVAEERLAEASAVRETGARKDFLEHSLAAREGFEAALASSSAWFESIAAQYGETDRIVSSVRRARQDWTRKLMALRKTR